MLTYYRYRFVLCLVFTLMMCVGAAYADITSITDNGLYFGLEQDTVFVRNSNGDSTLEQASINFSMTFGVNDVAVPTGNLSMISFELTFDPDSLTFYRANAVGSWTVDTTTIEAGRLWVQIYGDTIQPPDDDPTTFVELIFYAKCQPEKSADAISFDRIRCYATVGGVPYVPDLTGQDNWQDGAVHVADYVSTYFVDTLSVTAGYDSVVSVPVRLYANFRTAWAYQVIYYDSTKLEFVEMVETDLLYGGIVFAVNMGNYVRVTEWKLSDPIPKTDPDTSVLYWLRFRIRDDVEWDGDTTALTFDTDSCFTRCSTLGDGGSGSYCMSVLADDPPFGLVDGAVILERYEATFNAVPTNDTTYFGDSVAVPYTLQLKNSFYAGMPVDSQTYWGNIVFNVMGLDNTTFSSISDIDEDLYFATVPDSPYFSIDERWASSPATNVWAPRESFDDVLQLNIICHDLPEPTSWENRFFVPFAVTDSAPSFSRQSRVVDVNGVITADSTNGRLTWEVEPIEIAMGEWDGQGGTSGTGPQVTADVKIRHNMDLSDFQVRVRTGPEFEIWSVTPGDDVSVQTTQCDTNYSCRLIYADSGVVFYATGDQWQTIATITYQLREGCEEDSAVASTVYFTDRFMVDTHGDTVYTIGDTSAALSAMCYSELMEEEQLEDVGSGDNRAEAFTLMANYPNPFNPSTQIRFNLGSPCHVTLEVFNITGQRVVSLADRQFGAGSHVVEWNGRNSSGHHVASGVYLYRLRAGDFIATRKMVLLR